MADLVVMAVLSQLLIAPEVAVVVALAEMVEMLLPTAMTQTEAAGEAVAV